MLTRSCSVSIQWEFQAVWKASRNISPPFHQLKSFIHPRINLSPFTKDFRVWETTIETFNNLSSFLWGSNYLQRYTSPSLSKCISFHHIVADWAAPRCSGPHIYSGRAQKWETLQENLWSQQHPVFPGGHPSKYCMGLHELPSESLSWRAKPWRRETPLAIHGDTHCAVVPR